MICNKNFHSSYCYQQTYLIFPMYTFIISDGFISMFSNFQNERNDEVLVIKIGFSRFEGLSEVKLHSQPNWFFKPVFHFDRKFGVKITKNLDGYDIKFEWAMPVSTLTSRCPKRDSMTLQIKSIDAQWEQNLEIAAITYCANLTITKPTQPCFNIHRFYV